MNGSGVTRPCATNSSGGRCVRLNTATAFSNYRGNGDHGKRGSTRSRSYAYMCRLGRSYLSWKGSGVGLS